MALQNTIKYVVKQGDSLYSIAMKYDTTPNEIINLNKLASSIIYPNQVLFIPKRKEDTKTEEYLTVNGDTINKIINKKNMTLDQFNKLNNEFDLELAPNQVIKVGDTERTFYTIKQTDSLDDILNKNGITAYELLKLNKDTLIKPGTKIIVK